VFRPHVVHRGDRGLRASPVRQLQGLEVERSRSASLDVGRHIGYVALNGTFFGSEVRDPLMLRHLGDGSRAVQRSRADTHLGHGPARAFPRGCLPCDRHLRTRVPLSWTRSATGGGWCRSHRAMPRVWSACGKPRRPAGSAWSSPPSSNSTAPFRIDTKPRAMSRPFRRKGRLTEYERTDPSG
jgi:hypothetical protein